MEFKRLSVLPGVHINVLPTAKFKTIRIKLFWRWPLAEESVTKTALLPMVMKRGCAPWPTNRDIAIRLESLYGAGFGMDVTKIGETQNIEFDLEVADDSYIGSTERRVDLLKQGLEFLHAVTMQPLLPQGAFREEYVTGEKAILRRKIEALINDKPRYALTRLLENMCRHEPFSLYRYGRVADLDAITPERLGAHYYRLIEQAVMEFYIVGGVEPERAVSLVADLWRLPKREPLSFPAAGRQPAGETRLVREEQDVKQAVLAIGLRQATTYTSDDYPALLVQNGILGGYPHSKLFINVREKHSMAYFAYSRLDTTKGLQFLLAGIDAARFQEALDLITAQLEETKAGKISQEELEAAQKSITNDFLSSRDDAGQIIDADYLGQVNNKPRRIEETLVRVNQVTVEDVMRVAAGATLDTIYFLSDQSRKDGITK
ncbi:MAG TPA: insulinase family protein [Firmicutes bacterium]|nr:insulinase family protein [Bacillota bacterium]